MPQSYAGLYYHLIFRTKNNATRIPAEHLDSLYAYIGGIVRTDKGALLAAGGMPDHIHLLLSFSRHISIADGVQHIKSRSSSWLHDQGCISFRWQTGYSVFSVSPSILPKVEKYIRNQRSHHARMSFVEELKLFFERYKIVYDAKYLVEEDNE